ncbi:MAG: helix-turn-helix transcriptional regulator, partial [Bacteroidota bacterium]
AFVFISVETKRLQNYLRTFRKRTGLSQDEIAFLLGCQSGSKVSRCERLRRVPNLETALAYEVIFRVPVRELFAGLFEKVERKTIRRVGQLARKLHNSKGDRFSERKLEALAVAVREAGKVLRQRQ